MPPGLGGAVKTPVRMPSQPPRAGIFAPAPSRSAPRHAEDAAGRLRGGGGPPRTLRRPCRRKLGKDDVALDLFVLLYYGGAELYIVAAV